MPQPFQSRWAEALFNPSLPAPAGVLTSAPGADERFSVYRNNVMAGLTGALSARFPATKRIVGEDFFNAAARAFAANNPPRSPLMMTYGDEFPGFLARFEPAQGVPYLADVARLEAARTRAYHAADAPPLAGADLASLAPDALASLRFTLHPSLEIISSPYPVVTIWAMNAGEIALDEITDWDPQTALIVRPRLDVEARLLPSGADVFLDRLSAGATLAEAAGAAREGSADFDLAVNLAALFCAGLAIEAIADEAKSGKAKDR